MLKFETKGQKSANNKPNIYFACYPDDKKVYFDSIAEEIWDIRNCAIFFEEDYSAPFDAEELEFKLKSMQLVVIPVTDRLLRHSSRAIDFELKCAIKNHVPVLPLMKDEVQIEMYEKHFGKLHALDKRKQDVFSVSYGEQLRRFINAVLVNDELAKQIRAEFDAHIFLSYRKIDIKAAQGFMDMVHGDPKFRDVAIWFDNFLTPGEDYEDNIEKAIENCDIFSLVVTPNIYRRNAKGKTNYVMAKEYPDARDKYQKTIMPAEMEILNEAEKEELYTAVSDLPELVKKDKIPDRINEILLSHTKRENDTDPRHNYLIGMAYLNGVDVEKRTDIAREMIKQSAEQHYPDAISKIVEMYRNGIGFERDYDEAIKWQERLVAAKRDLYEKNPTADACHWLFWDMIDLGDFLRENTQFGEALAIYEEAGNLCRLHIAQQESRGEKPDINLRRGVATSSNRQGDLHEHCGEHERAIEKYLKALETFSIIAVEDQSPQSASDLAVCYELVGSEYLIHGNPKEAIKYFERSLGLQNQLVPLSDTLETRRGQYLFYGKLGEAYAMLGDTKKAFECHTASKEMREALFADTKSLLVQMELSICYSALGDLLMKQYDIPAAVQHYEKALELRLAAEKGTPPAEHFRRLAAIYNRLGDAHTLDIEKAEGYYLKALEAATGAYEISCIPKAIDDLIVCKQRIADMLVKKGNTDEALKLFVSIMGLFEQLQKATPTPEVICKQAKNYMQLGRIYDARNDAAKTEENYNKAHAVLEQLNKQNPLPEVYNTLIVCRLTLGDFCKKQKEYDKATEFYHAGISLIKEHYNSIEPLVAAVLGIEGFEKIADLYVEQGDRVTAGLYYTKGAEFSEMACRRKFGTQERISLADLFCGIADKFSEIEEHTQAALYYNRSVELLDSAPHDKEFETHVFLKRLEYLEKLSVSYMKQNLRDDYISTSEQIIALLQSTADMIDHKVMYDQIVSKYNAIIRLLTHDDDLSSAVGYIDKIEETLKKAYAETNDSQYINTMHPVLMDKAKILSALHDPSGAIQTLNDAMQYTDIFPGYAGNQMRATMLSKISREHVQLDENEKARDALLQAIRLMTAEEEGVTYDSDAFLGSLYSELGAIYMQLRQYEDALQTYEEAISLWRRLFNQKGRENVLRNLADCLHNAGVLLCRSGNYDKAHEYYLEAADINKTLFDATKNSFYRYSLGLTFIEASNTSKSKKEALDLLDAAHGIFIKLVNEEPLNLSYFRILEDLKRRRSKLEEMPD